MNPAHAGVVKNTRLATVRLLKFCLNFVLEKAPLIAMSEGAFSFKLFKSYFIKSYFFKSRCLLLPEAQHAQTLQSLLFRI